MKKYLTILLFIAIFINKGATQSIPNGNFDFWTTVSHYEDPANYKTTSNMNSYFSGISFGNVIKTIDEHSGSLAAQLTTIQAQGNIMAGILILGKPAKGNRMSDGIPYTDKPDSVKFFAKNDIKPNDTAFVMIMFSKNGQPIGSTTFLISGTQSTYMEYKSAISWMPGESPDTLNAVIMSSGGDNAVSQPGSTLLIDDITFISNIGSVAAYPNGGFENWNTITTTEPNNWTTFNLYSLITGKVTATRELASYDGNYALRLENMIMSGQNQQNDTIGVITNGIFGNNGPEGGMHLDQNPTLFSGWYKFLPDGVDSGAVLLATSRWDNILEKRIKIDSVMYKLKPADIYTNFEIPFHYNGIPAADTLTISFSAGNIDKDKPHPKLGSVLIIDKLEVSYNPMSIEHSLQSTNMSISPNPSNGAFYINIPESKNKQTLVEVINCNGQQIFSNLYTPGKAMIDLSIYPKGIYLLKTQNNEVISINKLLIK